MVQKITLFKGLPADLVLKLEEIIADSEVIFQVLTTSVSAEYIIIHGTEA